jgi:hypothetical protein
MRTGTETGPERWRRDLQDFTVDFFPRHLRRLRFLGLQNCFFLLEWDLCFCDVEKEHLCICDVLFMDSYFQNRCHSRLDLSFDELI